MSFSLEGPGWALLLAVAALALAAWSWRRSERAPRAARILRVMSLCWLALCLVRLTPQRTRVNVVKPLLAMVLDTSPTMGNLDGGRESRLQRTVRWLGKNRARIEERAEPVLYAGSDRARRVSWRELEALKPGSAGLDAGQSLEDAVKEGAVRVWLFSDGGAGFGQGPADVGGRLAGAPIDAAGVGPKGSPSAARVAEIHAPDFVFLHSAFSLSATIEAEGLKGNSVSAVLWKGSRAVSERRIEIGQDFEIATASFTAAAESLGQEDYRLEVKGTGAKLSDRRDFQVEVIRQKHRIMYLAGRPSFEYAQLREYLKSDPNHELVSFVILRNPENLIAVPDQELSLIPFPAQEIFMTDLFQFDVFILENFAYWRFALPPVYLENLRRFVAQGGALLVIGGTDAFSQGGYRGTMLEEVLPVNLWGGGQDFAGGLFKPKIVAPDHPLLRVGDTVEASKVLWDALPPLDGFNRFASAKPGASVLLAHPTERGPDGNLSPILAVWNYGKGRVMALGTDTTWRWRLGAGLDWRLSNFYGRFWSGAIQYLSGTLDLKKVKFSPLPKRLVAAPEPLSVGLHLFDAGFRPLSGSEADLRVLWTPPGGPPRPVTPIEKEPGIFELRLTGLVSGRHSLRATARYRGQAWGEDEIHFDWEPRPPELPLNRRWLKQLSGEAQGRYADLDKLDLDDWLSALPAPKPEREVLQTWHPFDSPWALAVLGVLLAAEWIIRRRFGLL